MRMTRSGWTSLFAVVGILALSSLGLAAEFSADFVSSGAGQAGSGTLYVKGKGLFRREETQGKRKIIVILNADKKAMWLVNPAEKVYIASPYQPQMVAMMTGVPSAKDTKLVKTEKVGGYVCEKRTVASKQPGVSITLWVAKELGITVKADVNMGKQGTAHMEVKNIQKRTLSPALFLPPKGYKQVTQPTGPGGGGSGRAPAGRGRGR
jgi:outer membrane lipoprotein-sorting protein